MTDLSNLSRPANAHRERKRLGRGPGSGLGKTSGKGNKGHKASTGGGIHPWFEGGQMPLQRRVPKRGFRNPFRTAYQVINVADWSHWPIDRHHAGAAPRRIARSMRATACPSSCWVMASSSAR